MEVEAGVHGVFNTVGRVGVVGAGEYRTVRAGGVLGLQARHALGADEASAVASQTLDDHGLEAEVDGLDGSSSSRAARAQDAYVGLDGLRWLAELLNRPDVVPGVCCGSALARVGQIGIAWGACIARLRLGCAAGQARAGDRGGHEACAGQK